MNESGGSPIEQREWTQITKMFSEYFNNTPMVFVYLFSMNASACAMNIVKVVASGFLFDRFRLKIYYVNHVN